MTESTQYPDDDETPAALAKVPYFSVQEGSRVVIPAPIPRNLGQELVRCSENPNKWETIKALRPVMRPWPWLDMVLRLQDSMKASPTPIRKELLGAFPHFRDYLALGLSAQSWWRSSDDLRIWRACYEGVNERGMCWSADPLAASQYAREGRCGDAKPVLIEGHIRVGHCIAHMLRRNEVQVLVDPDKVTFKARYPLPFKDSQLLEWVLPRAM